MSTCHKCGKTVHEIGGWLDRVNPTGEVPAVWECAPSCDAQLTKDEALLGAVTGEYKS